MRANNAVAADTERVTATPVTGLRPGAFLGYRWALLAFLGMAGYLSARTWQRET